ncbi:uncharacterized protein LOC119722039 [Patiria miniata]|uniref:Uncharacterized protein n=1 Tax=Patiria miniata TaxID=46514 RepID=A0A913Z8G7_PATMI|nr:uncharacterized protein LOC119722039 [Patiria miniata]
MRYYGCLDLPRGGGANSGPLHDPPPSSSTSNEVNRAFGIHGGDKAQLAKLHCRPTLFLNPPRVLGGGVVSSGNSSGPNIGPLAPLPQASPLEPQRPCRCTSGCQTGMCKLQEV